MARFLFGLPSGSPTDGSSAFILSLMGAAEPTLTPKRPAPPCRACGRTSGILSPGVDDAHAAAAEHRLDLVARDARQGPPPPGYRSPSVAASSCRPRCSRRLTVLTET